MEGLATQTLEGVTNADVSLVYPREDNFYWDGGGDRNMVDRPRATVDLSWVFGSGINESNIGFTSSPSGTVSALAGLNNERNYYILINQDGRDSVGYIDNGSRVMALGNGLITRYGFNANVGQPTTVSISLEALNLLSQVSGQGQVLPSIYKQYGTGGTATFDLPTPAQEIGDYFESAPSALQLYFNTGCAFGALLSGNNSCPIESFGFTVDIPRAEVKDLGWAYPNERPIQWPVNVSIQASARLTQFQLDTLNRMNCPDSGYSFEVKFKSGCAGLDDFAFLFRGAKLDSQSFGVAVGGGVAKLGLNWSLKISDVNRVGPNDSNFFIIAEQTAYTSIYFPQVSYVVGSSPFVIDLGTPSYLSILNGTAFLDGNYVYMTDTPGVVTVRVTAADGSDTQDLVITITEQPAYSSIIFPDVEYVSGSSPLQFDLSAPAYLSIFSGPATLTNNNVYITETPGTVLVRVLESGGTGVQDLTVTLT